MLKACPESDNKTQWVYSVSTLRDINYTARSDLCETHLLWNSTPRRATDTRICGES